MGTPCARGETKTPSGDILRLEAIFVWHRQQP